MALAIMICLPKILTNYENILKTSNFSIVTSNCCDSEVLLTSEARMVTYVNKQNVRSEHTLEEVLQTGKS